PATWATILSVVSLLCCAGAVALSDPHLVASLLRYLLASNRSNDLCCSGGTTGLSHGGSLPAAPVVESSSILPLPPRRERRQRHLFLTGTHCCRIGQDQHQIDGNLPGIIRPLLNRSHNSKGSPPTATLNLLCHYRIFLYHHHRCILCFPRHCLAASRYPVASMALLPPAAHFLFSSPVAAATHCRSRASAATAFADGSSHSRNCFPYILLYCCSFFPQQSPNPRSFAAPLLSACPTSLLDHDRI
ncbi:hypothetical protein B296_00054546, partial [Ensete ventricosum]